MCLGVRKDLTPEVERRVVSQNLSIRAFVQESQVEILEEDEMRGLGFGVEMFVNVNTPRDWERVARGP